MRGGDDDTGFLSKSEHYKDGSGPLAAAHPGKAKGVLTRPVEWGVGKIAGDKSAQNAVNAMRVTREGTKSLGRVAWEGTKTLGRTARAVGETGLYLGTAAADVGTAAADIGSNAENVLKLFD